MQSDHSSQIPQASLTPPTLSTRRVTILIWWAAGSFAAILGFSRLSYGLLLPALRNALGGSYSGYGYLGTLNFVGYLLGTLVLPLVLPYVRRRLSLELLALCAMNVTLLASGLSFTIWQLGIWRLLNGFFAALATVLTIALTLECVPPTKRGTASGLIWAGGAVGITLSGLITALILTTGSNAGWRVVWIGMGIVGIVVAFGFSLTRRSIVLPTAYAIPEQLAVNTQSSRKPLRVILLPLFQPRKLLFLTLAYCSFGCGYIIYFTFLIALLEQQGISVFHAGFVWAAIGVTGVLSSRAWGKVMDRWPTGFALALPLLLGAIGALSVLLHSLIWEYAGAALVGLCASITPALMVTALLKRAVTDANYATSLSVLTGFFALGQIVGPLVSSLIVEKNGLIAGIASSVLALGIAAVCACGYGMMQRRAQKSSSLHDVQDTQEISLS